MCNTYKNEETSDIEKKMFKFIETKMFLSHSKDIYIYYFFISKLTQTRQKKITQKSLGI